MRFAVECKSYMFRALGKIAGIAALTLITRTALAIEVSGHVRIEGRGNANASTAIVYAEWLDGPTPVHPVRRKLVQKNKSFVPSVLAIPAGSTVDFPNEDPIFHNVFSLSKPEPFDVGLYRAGASKSRVFSQPATYRVFCNIHPQMTAVILVLPTSWIAEADSSGEYRFDLPPGRYRITAWSDRSQPSSTELTVGAEPATVAQLSLNESNYVELPHKNKYGQDYANNSYNPLKH
jgi:plastocyanin